HLRSVVVVGASLAGLSAVETLRREGFVDRIVVIGEEDRLPYDRPPLSKQVLAGVAEPEATALRPDSAVEALEAEWRLGRRAVGLDLAEALPVPLAGALGPEAGAWCSQLHPDHGVRLHCGVTVTGFEGSGRVEALRLSDGRLVPADLVVVGVGVVPATGWLDGSGLA